MNPRDASAVASLLERNRAFFKPFEPTRPPHHFTSQGQKREIEQSEVEWIADRGYAFGVFLQRRGLIGRVSLSNVFRRSWQNANLGYFLDQRHNRRGYTTTAVKLAVEFAFAEAGLHRVQAGTLVDNAGSIRVLEKAGFRFEGTALSYLKIDGEWRDHRIFAITREEWRRTPEASDH